MKFIIFTFILFFGYNLFGQNLTCKDFKNGTFTNTSTESDGIELQIIRQGNSQIETITKMPQELLDLGYPVESTYVIIKWLSECSYILTADSSRGELSESSKLINDSGGILTELVYIEGNCFNYKSIGTYQGEEFISYGKLCKENEM